MNRTVPVLGITAALFLAGAGPTLAADAPSSLGVADSQEHRVEVVQIAGGLRRPWALAFLPDGGMLVTERPGRLRMVRDGRLLPDPVAGLPEVTAQGQGGLMDVALHPGFERNRWVYLSYAASGQGGVNTEVARGRLADGRLEAVEVIFRARPKASGGRHFGSRLLFVPDGTLYVSLGERGQRRESQNLRSHLGAMVRLHDDGRVPEDNPFADRPDALPEIYSYGHRNIQGLALQPGSGVIWSHEHGPQGGDELNVLGPGRNYGWPVITYGRNYVTGTRIGEGERKAGMEQPVHYWDPSIAPSGLAFYDGEAFPRWQGNLLVGSLKFAYVARLVLDGSKVVHEEALLRGRLGRIRDVRLGPDGYVYLLTDEDDGRLLRLQPAG